MRAIRTRRDQNGLTLIEVLVALAIISVVVLGLARSASTALDAQHQLEITTLGSMVAANALAELELSGNLVPSRRQGESTLADRLWYWEALVQPTPDGSMLRVDVAVYESIARDSPALIKTGFISL